MPSTRLPEAATSFSLILPSASFIQSNFLYSAFLLLHLLPNISNTQELSLHSKGHSKSTLSQRNLPKIISDLREQRGKKQSKLNVQNTGNNFHVTYSLKKKNFLITKGIHLVSHQFPHGRDVLCFL